MAPILSAQVVAVLCLAAVGYAANVDKRKISPDLDPKSDKKFFGPPFPADYPSDLRPGGDAKFSYPFPHVQHSSKYDDDFVKDENSDDGEWQAQSEYDRLKSKLHQEQMEAEAAQRQEEKETAEAAAAKTRKADAEVNAQKMMSEEATLNQLKSKVEAKLSNLEDCKKQLEEAQQALKEYTEQSVESGDLSAVDKETAEATLKKEEDEARNALKSYEEEKQDVEEAEAALRAAESRLRAMRRGPAPVPSPPPPPAEPKPDNSGSSPSQASLLLLPVLMATFSALM
eukprot:TRINITY_DN15_c0_g3_i1.p1 TRINITY_DN15_c0_g3~~TRINITY_DN15_c0_g3_i1.p1  ORF type:complete len:299 (-),score=98.94 TRINITY_DN15_c0_g3_i1:233-1087(-)